MKKTSKKTTTDKTIILPKTILLPVTEVEFESLINLLMEKYGFTDYTEVAFVLGNTIQRLPTDQDRCTLEYFAACIRKATAYRVARHFVSEQMKKAKINDAVDVLKVDPTNKEAMAYLTEESTKGSEYATQCLDEILSTETKTEEVHESA